jgi:serine protease Do
LPFQGNFFNLAVMNRFMPLVSGFWLMATLSAETVKDREGAVRGDKAKLENSERWIYNDLQAGFAEAEKTGKPLMVVLRCVPCLACMGLDTEVLVENPELTPLMDQFVRVRLINANSLDLSLFQFDYDLSFSVLFLNADRTIYGRYGSWEHQQDSQNRATASLREALARVLELHAGFPTNRAALAGKKGDPMAYRTPVDLPEIKKMAKYGPELDWSGKVVGSCVHCHQIGDAVRSEIREGGGTMPLKWLFPYPTAGSLGMTLAEDSVTGVAALEEGGIASRGGLKVGDEIVALDGQALVSVADLSWALHRFADAGSLPVTVKRGGESLDLSLDLPQGWRAKGPANGKRVGYWPMRAMAFGGMKLEDLDETARKARGIGSEVLALEALHVGEYGKHAAAKKAGFRKGDVIVEVAGSTAPLTEIELLAKNLLERKPGEKVPVAVLRDGARVTLEMPVQ